MDRIEGQVLTKNGIRRVGAAAPPPANGVASGGEAEKTKKSTPLAKPSN
jgi:hypothetical protein